MLFEDTEQCYYELFGIVTGIESITRSKLSGPSEYSSEASLHCSQNAKPDE